MACDILFILRKREDFARNPLSTGLYNSAISSTRCWS